MERRLVASQGEVWIAQFVQDQEVETGDQIGGSTLLFRIQARAMLMKSGMAGAIGGA